MTSPATSGCGPAATECSSSVTETTWSMLYGAFDLFVLASHREGFPARRWKLPRWVCPSSPPTSGAAGRSSSTMSTACSYRRVMRARFRAALSRLVAEPATRHRMGLASIERAAQLFDDRAVCERVLASYRNIAARKGIELVPVSRASSAVHG